MAWTRGAVYAGSIMAEIPILVAHRGYAAHWPENTLPALDAAVAAGARWVEVDVQLCADGVPVLLHDEDLERVSGHPTSVFAVTAAALAGIAVGEPARFGKRFAHTRAPTLAEFAAWLAGHPEVSAFVELKTESLARFGRSTVVDACREAMAGVANRWAIISFDYESLVLARKDAATELGWVVRGFDEELRSRALALPARWLFCNHERLPPGPLPSGPWDWVIYEVADAALARDLLARGASWLETRAIGELRSATGKSV
jgi:glycerophosphoryl diester phosphodiesterase